MSTDAPPDPEPHVTLAGLPPELIDVLRDQSIIVPQDAAVFDLIASWAKAPSATASADFLPGVSAFQLGQERGGEIHDSGSEKGENDVSGYVLAVNGHPTLIERDGDTPLSEVAAEAILATGNERWGGEDRWEFRSPAGVLLDGTTKLSDLAPNPRGVHAFLQLKPGVGA